MKLIQKFQNPSGTIQPILVTPTKVGHDYTVYDNREMIPEGAYLTDEERHKQKGQRGARAINRAQERGKNFVMSTVGIVPTFLTSLNPLGLLSLAGGVVGSNVGQYSGMALDKAFNNKEPILEQTGSAIGGLIGGAAAAPAYYFTKYPLYRQGLYDFFKYRNTGKPWPKIERAFNPNERKYAIIPKRNQRELEVNEPTYDILMVKKGNENELYQYSNQDELFHPFLTQSDSRNKFVIEPHLKKAYGKGFLKALKSAPSGTYLIDTPEQIYPFGAQLKNSNIYDFLKLLYKPNLNSVVSKKTQPFSLSSYIQLLKLANKPQYDLRYTNQKMPYFNNNDFNTKDGATFIDMMLRDNPNGIIDDLNNLFLKNNPNAKLIKINNGQVEIPTPSLLVK